jgi:phosphomevalonate kinase
MSLEGGAVALTVRAPGKVVLFGEYAVVEGAPFAALVAAVDRHVTCRYTPGGAGVEIVARGLPPEAGAPIFAEAAVAHARVRPAGRYELDSAAFHTVTETGERVKLGLGSSAAVCVALTGALLAAGMADLEAPAVRREVFECALAAHREASGGKGSGVDVAASAFGGLSRYTLHGPTPADAVVAPLAAGLPGGHLGLVFAGASADTRALLTQVGGLKARVPEATWLAHLARLDAARGAAESAISDADDAALLGAVTAGRTAVEALAAATGAPLRGPPAVAAAVETLAAAFGGAWKTTGAGGGDLYWVCTPAGVSPAKVAEAAARAGLVWLRVGVDSVGVRLMSSHSV